MNKTQSTMDNIQWMCLKRDKGRVHAFDISEMPTFNAEVANESCKFQNHFYLCFTLSELFSHRRSALFECLWLWSIEQPSVMIRSCRSLKHSKFDSSFAFFIMRTSRLSRIAWKQSFFLACIHCRWFNYHYILLLFLLLLHYLWLCFYVFMHWNNREQSKYVR